MLPKKYRILFAHVILACLALQPFSIIAGFDFKQNLPKQSAKNAPASKVTLDFKTTSLLNSPRMKDLALFKEMSSFRLSKSHQLLSLLTNKHEISPENYTNLFPGSELKEKRAWIKLLDMLQLTNEPGKKSITSTIGKTITQAGAASFVNIIARENHDWTATKKRQDFIRFLVENPNELKLIQERLVTIKEFEPILLKELFRQENQESQGTILLAFGAALWLLVNWFTWKLQTGEDHVLGNGDKWYCGLKLPALLNLCAGLIVAASKTIEQNDIVNGPFQNIKNALLALTSAFLMIEGTGFMLAPGETAFRTLQPIMWILKSGPMQNGLKPKLKQWSSNAKAEIDRKIEAYKKTSKYSASHEGWYTWKTNIWPWGPNAIGAGILNAAGAGNNTQIKAKLNRSFDSDNAQWYSSRVGAGALFVGAMLGFYLKDKHAQNKLLFARAQGAAQVVKCSNDLFKLLHAHPVASAYEQLFADFSDDYKSLIEKAGSQTVHADARYSALGLFTVNQARINSILELTKTTFGEAAKLTNFYGEIDAYAAVAQMILDHQTTSNTHGEEIRCCFAELDQQSTEAYAQVHEMWHPIIPTDRVRTNSITLGGSPETPRNGIITGPNAAGKSVSMKALLINIIFGQAFGVGFAKSLKFTPFKKIIAQFGSADDTANDQSKFMYEATSVVDLLKQLKDLSPEDKALVFTDELFSGTEVTPAILLSVELCSRVSVLKNVCYILATHYKDLTQLKEITNNAFENYKVTATVDENSKISYPFKLQHGIGDTNVAFDIFLDQMRKQGVNDPELEAIIRNARARQHAISV